MISKPVGSDPDLINNKLWAGTQNVVSEPIGFTPRGYYLFNLGSNPDFKIVTVGFKPTLILGLNVFTCISRITSKNPSLFYLQHLVGSWCTNSNPPSEKDNGQ